MVLVTHNVLALACHILQGAGIRSGFARCPDPIGRALPALLFASIILFFAFIGALPLSSGSLASHISFFRLNELLGRSRSSGGTACP